MNTRADRASETRYRIERAAIKHFVEQGIGETTIRDIAKTAAVSLGAMYNHYDSKEDLAFNIFRQGFEDAGRRLRKCAEAQTTLPNKLRDMIRFAFSRFDEDPLLLTYVFTSRHIHLGHRRLGRLADSPNNPYAVFRVVIADAMARKEIPNTDPDLAASLVTGAVIQAIDSCILGRLKGKMIKRADETAAMCFRLLKG
ncbi:MAG: TetR/AcrR family transcriptional regulator [Alphaproteobacteria bacterium]|nr:TetR/AcrR family transcriptional regulator [Alphaproteobacteria bacterium]MCZ6496208.1 TetR/AcrR family transcriptional regulator [Alphaproteobacteria bacterium]MCZ6742902.1 TetR/AcrR family transcriptional regulator [Alphaproteobacteria bacterium]MCZ6861375.1 TetR/AcrR family transcriptional regulator [Alphaproteobacteria bacterium]